MSNDLDLVAGWLHRAASVVAFTGAGMSTESGIPDFRSPGGIWATSQPVYFHDFLASPDARREYWRQKAVSHRDFSAAEPNAGHRTLAKWQRSGRLKRVITQNIDGLHTLAGNEGVLELHGTARKVGCLACQTQFEAEEMVRRYLELQCPPDCPRCGGILKHSTISFGQSLPEETLNAARRLSEEADLFLVLGSSLVVQPAAALPCLAQQHGSRLVIMNRDPTPLNSLADAVITTPLADTLVELDRRLDRLASP